MTFSSDITPITRPTCSGYTPNFPISLCLLHQQNNKWLHSGWWLMALGKMGASLSEQTSLFYILNNHFKQTIIMGTHHVSSRECSPRLTTKTMNRLNHKQFTNTLQMKWQRFWARRRHFWVNLHVLGTPLHPPPNLLISCIDNQILLKFGWCDDGFFAWGSCGLSFLNYCPLFIAMISSIPTMIILINIIIWFQHEEEVICALSNVTIFQYLSYQPVHCHGNSTIKTRSYHFLSLLASLHTTRTRPHSELR